ncbi:MAG: TIGR00730 family Rossman fold protein, partial [Bacteroidaceae bacterium]|nr:TIGR00730 family Rossman fold protein [Bacteroidaceae bacterium]
AQKIGVFLSSHDQLPESYIQATRDVGRWIGATGRVLVYGGSRYGLMEVLAQAIKSAGGRVYGVVPQIVTERGKVSDCIDVEFRTADLTDRKAVIDQHSDLFVALPGGIGTLDEVFTMLGQVSIGISQKWVLLYDVDGCWSSLVALLDDLVTQGLVARESLSRLAVVRSVAELEAAVAIAAGQNPEMP